MRVGGVLQRESLLDLDLEVTFVRSVLMLFLCFFFSPTHQDSLHSQFLYCALQCGFHSICRYHVYQSPLSPKLVEWNEEVDLAKRVLRP